MKKWTIITTILLSVCCLFGCANKNLTMLKNNIAEIRENMYVGENKEIYATLSSGKREKDYIVNGYATEQIEFGVLTFKLTAENIEFEDFEPYYVLFVGTKRYDGSLEKNPFDGSFVADLKKIINTNDLVKAKIMCGKFVSEVELTCVTKDWEIDSNKALKIAIKNWGKDIEELKENGNLNAEVYVKIVSDDEIKNGAYYWYVNIVGRKGRSFAIIIDPISGEILAKK